MSSVYPYKDCSTIKDIINGCILGKSLGDFSGPFNEKDINEFDSKLQNLKLQLDKEIKASILKDIETEDILDVFDVKLDKIKKLRKVKLLKNLLIDKKYKAVVNMLDYIDCSYFSFKKLSHIAGIHVVPLKDLLRNDKTLEVSKKGYKIKNKKRAYKYPYAEAKIIDIVNSNIYYGNGKFCMLDIGKLEQEIISTIMKQNNLKKMEENEYHKLLKSNTVRNITDELNINVDVIPKVIDATLMKIAIDCFKNYDLNYSDIGRYFGIYRKRFADNEEVKLLNQTIDDTKSDSDSKLEKFKSLSEMYKEKGINKSVFTIASEAGIHYTAKNLIKYEFLWDEVRRKHSNIIENIEKNIETIITEYKKDPIERLALNDLKEKYGGDVHIITTSLYKHGVTTNEFKNKPKRKYTYNENAFEQITTEKQAYWLEMLYTDGGVTNENNKYVLELSLKEKDVEMLEKFKTFLGYTGDVTSSDSKSDRNSEKIFRRSRLFIHGKEFVESLVKHGVKPRKTFDLKFPNENILPSNLIPHFLRAVFDGDGNVCLTSNNSLMIRISSAAEDFMEKIDRYLQSHGLQLKKEKGDRCGYNIMSTMPSTVSKPAKFYELIYKDQTVCLDRKKQIFDKYFNIMKESKKKDYTLIFKKKIIQLYNNTDETIASISKKYNIPKSTIQGWNKKLINEISTVPMSEKEVDQLKNEIEQMIKEDRMLIRKTPNL